MQLSSWAVTFYILKVASSDFPLKTESDPALVDPETARIMNYDSTA